MRLRTACGPSVSDPIGSGRGSGAIRMRVKCFRDRFRFATSNVIRYRFGVALVWPRGWAYAGSTAVCRADRRSVLLCTQYPRCPLPPRQLLPPLPRSARACNRIESALLLCSQLASACMPRSTSRAKCGLGASVAQSHRIPRQRHVHVHRLCRHRRLLTPCRTASIGTSVCSRSWLAQTVRIQWFRYHCTPTCTTPSLRALARLVECCAVHGTGRRVQADLLLEAGPMSSGWSTPTTTQWMARARRRSTRRSESQFARR
jgi:hypothetical protein